VNKATLDMGQVADAMQQIDEAQAVIAAAMKGDPEAAPAEIDREVFHADGSPILTLTDADAAADLAGTPRPDTPTVPPVYVPAIDIAPSEELIDVVFSQPVSLYVGSSHREFVPGKTSITAGMYATIKQTHQADRVSRG
jgi:hypothetical protein